MLSATSTAEAARAGGLERNVSSVLRPPPSAEREISPLLNVMLETFIDAIENTPSIRCAGNPAVDASAERVQEQATLDVSTI